MTEREPGPASDEWFALQPRYSLPPSISVPPPPPKLPSRGRTALAGLVVGAVGGAACLALAQVLAKRDLAVMPGTGWAVAAAIGATIAVNVALVTRHVRRALPLAIFGVVFGPFAWLGVYVIAVRRHAAFAAALPLGPMLLGIALFGALLALIVPARGH